MEQRTLRDKVVCYFVQGDLIRNVKDQKLVWHDADFLKGERLNSVLRKSLHNKTAVVLCAVGDSRFYRFYHKLVLNKSVISKPLFNLLAEIRLLLRFLKEDASYINQLIGKFTLDLLRDLL